ncbi:MAG: hypothetical protein ABIL45_04260 [candidate division WOR-3 bacterium]
MEEKQEIQQEEVKQEDVNQTLDELDEEDIEEMVKEIENTQNDAQKITSSMEDVESKETQIEEAPSEQQYIPGKDLITSENAEILINIYNDVVLKFIVRAYLRYKGFDEDVVNEVSKDIRIPASMRNNLVRALKAYANEKFKVRLGSEFGLVIVVLASSATAIGDAEKKAKNLQTEKIQRQRQKRNRMQEVMGKIGNKVETKQNQNEGLQTDTDSR